VTILPGVVVGGGAVIAAGAVVREDCEPNTLDAGVPAFAKVTRTLDTRPHGVHGGWKLSGCVGKVFAMNEAVSTEALRSARRGGYETDRPEVLRLVPRDARRILELGCSNGALGAAVKQRQNATVLGVELDPAYAADAEAVLDRVVVGDAGEFAAGAPPDEAPFDCLICADVLEHLVDPWATLRHCASWLRPGGTAIVSLPNVLRYRNLRRIVMRRRWPRDASGPFDATHLRWFSDRDAIDLLAQADLRVERLDRQLWEARPFWKALLEAQARTPLAPFTAAQHILVGRKGP
jgi:SAM-dependent methyltransferase